MGYVMAHGYCFNCARLFSFNPDLVPSLYVNGARLPICQNCVQRVNQRRLVQGLPLIEPLPGAYEPMECV